MWRANRRCLPFRTPTSAPFWICLCSNRWDHFPRTCRVFHLDYPSVLFYFTEGFIYTVSITSLFSDCMLCYTDLKLTCHHINRRYICFNIKSISVHPLLWMNVMLDFICMVFAELLSTGYKRKIQNDKVCLRRESNQRPLAIQRVPLTTRLSGLLTTDMWIKLLHTYLRYDTTRTLCGVQRGDDLHKRRNLLCLICQWLYIIFILFLFIIVYIVCIIICFLILYLCFG